MMKTGPLLFAAIFAALVLTPTAAFADGSAAEEAAPAIDAVASSDVSDASDAKSAPGIEGAASGAPAADKNAEKPFRVAVDHRVLSLRSAIPFPPLKKHTVSDGKDTPKTIGYTTEIPGGVEFGVFHIAFGEKYYAQHVRGNEMRFIQAYYVIHMRSVEADPKSGATLRAFSAIPVAKAQVGDGALLFEYDVTDHKKKVDDHNYIFFIAQDPILWAVEASCPVGTSAEDLARVRDIFTTVRVGDASGSKL